MVIAPDFDRRANSYKARARVQREAAAWLAEWLPSKCAAPALELGAGTGFFTQHALRCVDRLVATDVSPRMVEEGRAILPGARWTVADATEPPQEPDLYRAVFTCSLVQWLPDPSAAFRRWHQSAAPGAVLLGGWFIRGTMDDFLSVCPEAAPFKWRSQEEWEQLLAGTGWRIGRSEAKTFGITHVSSAEMLRDMHEVGAFLPRRMGAGQLRAALRENDRRNRTDKGLTTNFVFLRLEAVRS